MSGRILAIGDIHGYSVALDALLETVKPTPEDQLVFLGDYVDKGPDTKGVLDRLVSLQLTTDSVFLRGNHDQMLVNAHRDESKYEIWESLCGGAPLSGFKSESGKSLIDSVPDLHWDFLENRCQDYYETDDFIFVHAGISPFTSPEEESTDRLHWSSLSLARQHESGRVVICGHSAQVSGKIADLGHTICIDTAIAKGGWLTCLSLTDWDYWQASVGGELQCGKLR